MIIIYKSCSICGRVHDSNYNCKVKRTYNKTDTDRLRSTYRWTKKAKQIKEDSNFLCAVCKEEGIYTYDNLEVHHIIKLKDDPNKLLDDNNLITLCTMHHKLADEGIISAKHLLELVKKRH